ncbi:MAG: PH domain-containing protein [Chloroflexota bacterium]
MGYVDQLLANEERVVLIAHRHPLFMLSRVGPLVFLMLVIWGLSLASWSFVPTVGSYLGLVLLIGSFVPLVISVYRFLWWRKERYIITSYRIIQVEGIVNRRTFDSALEKVNDVETSQSVFGRMFDYGTINIITGSEIGVNDLVGLSKPYEFKRALLEAKLAFGHDHGIGLRPERSEFVRDAIDDEDESGPDAPTRRFETVNDENDPSRVAIALTELRNAGEISEDEFQERMQRVTRG